MIKNTSIKLNSKDIAGLSIFWRMPQFIWVCTLTSGFWIILFTVLPLGQLVVGTLSYPFKYLVSNEREWREERAESCYSPRVEELKNQGVNAYADYYIFQRDVKLYCKRWADTLVYDESNE